MSALWNGEARLAREEIAKHVRKITLKPVFRTYVNSVGWPGRLQAASVLPEAGRKLRATLNCLFVVVREFGSFFKFAACLIKQLLGLFRVTAQLVLVGFLSFVDFFKSLYDVMLGFGEIWMLSGVNVCFRPLSQTYPYK